MDHVFECKHCNEFFIVNSKDFNCMILRHGVNKNTFQYINPHTAKTECDILFKNNMIYGCGKPLKIIKNNNGYEVIICEYI